jgi:hypothetical protein
MKVAAVKFRWSDKVYDYLIPDDLSVAAGQAVIVETRNGETKAEIVEIKAESEAATKSILRIAEAKKEEKAEDGDG